MGQESDFGSQAGNWLSVLIARERIERFSKEFVVREEGPAFGPGHYF
jgi:hypothetical protein